MPEPVVSLRGFSYRYPEASTRALIELELEISEGEFVVLAGRSASGKSTLIRALCGLVPHFHGGDVAGEARICGLDLNHAGPAELGRHVGMVAQDPESQVVSATPRAEIELPLEMRGESPVARARAVEEVALALGVEALLGRPTGSLSGGELQRVALAAALAARPSLILLDEPTSQLDPVAGDELIGVLRRLNEEWGTTVVLAEHRLERCLPAADRAIAIAAGELAFDGSPSGFCEWALRADPTLATPVARMFALAGLAPVPRGVKEARARLRLEGVSLPLERARQGDVPGDDGPDGAGPSTQRRRSPLRRRSRRPASEPVLEASDVWVELEAGAERAEALRGLGLRIDHGERVALMGRNGAGKTTLMRACAGLAKPLRGRLRTPDGCALVPQSPGDMLVRERIGDELPGEAGLQALRAVGLGSRSEADPRDLSGGERQRLALAIAMAGRDQRDGIRGLVCLDEPTRGMDRARKAELASWISELADAGAAVLLATHDVEFAADAVDRVVVMGRGEVLADGDADEILSGGWYFATEVARALGGGGAITPRAGAALLAERLTGLGTPAAADSQGIGAPAIAEAPGRGAAPATGAAAEVAAESSRAGGRA